MDSPPQFQQGSTAPTATEASVRASYNLPATRKGAGLDPKLGYTERCAPVSFRTAIKGNGGSVTVKSGSTLAISNATWGKHYLVTSNFGDIRMDDEAWNNSKICVLFGCLQ